MSEQYGTPRIGGGAKASVGYLTVLELLKLHHLPGRVGAVHSAALLGMEPQHLPILVAARLLKPLGNPPHNAAKYYARDHILALAADEKWLARASDALVAHWSNRNARKKR
jgi:hypothetical protein